VKYLFPSITNRFLSRRLLAQSFYQGERGVYLLTARHIPGFLQSMQKISRTANDKLWGFALQSKNIYIAGYKQISLCLLGKMNKNRIGRVT